MVIRYCRSWSFHQIKAEGIEQISFCSRENCYSRFSKFVMKLALNRFREQESIHREDQQPRRAAEIACGIKT